MKNASETLVETTTSTLEADVQTASLPFPEGVPAEYIGVNIPLIVDRPRYLRTLVCEHFTLDGSFKVKRNNGSNTALHLVCEYVTLDGNFKVTHDAR
ncbi:hypothetical protein K438DRAFT_1980366 [Mycena galopus ATCC 62051]|nr:hypothetical protein K438DRAFT_1980366 [Mycena galopus ATCC 62051]